jgi:osmotically-inducible protein OsmY
MRGHWTYVAAVFLVCGCQENNKPADTPTTTSTTMTTQPSTPQTSYTGTQQQTLPSANPTQSRTPEAGGTYGGSGDTTTWGTTGNLPETKTTGAGPSGTTGGTMGGGTTTMGGSSMDQSTSGSMSGTMGQGATGQGATTGGTGATGQGATTGGTGATGGTMDTADADRKMTMDVRKSITDMQGISTMAKNMTVSTSNGKVTLTGNVKSEAERKKIVDAVKKIAGDGMVDDQLTVKKANDTTKPKQ